MVVCSLLCSSCHGIDTIVYNEATSTDDLVKENVAWKTNKRGKLFSYDEWFAFDKSIDKCPLTFEATFSIPEQTVERAGVLFGNYSEAAKNILSFEIYSNGNPRVYYKYSSSVEEELIFDKVNVNTGDRITLAIVNDVSKGKISCYVDGELKQEILGKYDEKGIPDSKMIIGGDARIGNSEFFKGELFNFSVYSSVRLPSELKRDMTRVETDSKDLIAGFDISDLENEKIINSVNGRYSALHESIWVDNVKLPENYSYSFAVVGDTQIMNRKWPKEFHNIYDYVINHKESDKIAYCIGLGDITDCDSEEEWKLAKNEINRMNYTIPYLLNRGNHDSSYMFNNYFSSLDNYYPSSLSGFYRNNEIDNVYKLLRIQSQNYLIFALDYGPNDDVLKWAGDIIDLHPGYRTIISTHAYLYRDGTTLDQDDACPPTSTGGFNNGDQLWDKFIKRYNIDLVLCGHDPSRSIVISSSTNDNNFVVSEVLINSQEMDLIEPLGMVAVLYFSNEGQKIDIRYFSTVKNKWLKDDCQKSILINTLGF